ncbi:argininosuccinate synthase [Kamptonema cortianum]|nr:argininosuccinate synthase [Geitlerinema splendidum]MDK3158795.1 argininosuccinate synthase [Kamptonema cortianum]
MKHALIIFSGGLDTTVCVPMMRERGFERISTVCIDVGQPSEDISQATERAQILKTEHTVIDAKEEYASKHCFPAIHANADYYGYPLSTAIARPIIARKAAEFGLSHGADAFVHGCTGKGNDQFRIEYGLRLFAPDIPIIAPIREGNLTRSWEIEYAKRVGAPIGQSKDKIWSIDENVWGRSIEGGRLEDPSYAPPEEIFQWTNGFDAAPDQPQEVTISFENGNPVAIDGKPFSPLQIIQEANRIAGLHGVGRIDMMEDRMIGLKVRENYECPGATLLVAAHKALEALVTTHAERRFKVLVDQQWAEMAYQGLWWDPFMEDINAFIASVQSRVSGEVSVRLFKGGMQVTRRTSPWALYSEAAASFDDVEALEQSQMEGMVKTHGMASLLYAKLKK